MKHSTPPQIPLPIPRWEFRAALTKLSICVPLALVALSGNLSAQAQPLVVSMMPSYNQSLTYANAAINEPIQVWGRVSGGSGTYGTYTIDFGDGTPVASGAVNNTLNQFPISSPNRDFIMANHASLAGHVTVEDKVIIGGLSGVHQFCRLGTMSFIGGMARVNMDALPYMIIEGHDPKCFGPNAVGLERNGLDKDAIKRIRNISKQQGRKVWA